MAVAMDFALLGPLVVHCEGTVTTVSRGKERALLTALLLHANEVVLVDDLAEALWGASPPPSAEMTVRNYVKRLRRVLGETGGSRIVTMPGGYSIRVEPGELDIARFEDLASAVRASTQAGDWDQVSEQARTALALWRGNPLADAGSQVLAEREAPRLAEMRLQLLEARLDADIRSGDHAAQVPELYRLVQEYPLREHLHATLMLALYQCGRQGDALAAYRDARHVLVDELGVEPGPELRELHQRILAADPSLARTGPAQQVPAAHREGAPQQLPAAVGCFTGRTSELATLTSMLKAGPGAEPSTMVISAVSGTPGVGKTALALQWAHQIAERFPGGQLYVNLRGFDPAEPVSAEDALAGLLRSLGVSGADLPDGAEDRSRLYRSRLAGRRVLVLLDNARDSDQVRPLLPGDPGCVAVVTSRDTLAGLVAIEGARRLELDVLPLDDAVALLRSLIGGRDDDDPEAVTTLARLCARLPLALRIAAELVAARRASPLRELAAELAQAQLDCLDAGDDRADVRAVFSWSYRQLPGNMARTFALMGLHPGEDVDAHGTAALTGGTVGQARRELSRLHRASLIQPTGPDRYGMHDLLRAYAREQAPARDGHDLDHQALNRLFDYYLAAATAAMQLVFPAEANRRPRIIARAAIVPDLASPDDARAWLDRERANLVMVASYCANHRWPKYATGLAATLHRYLMAASYLPEAGAIYGHALRAARESGDPADEALALNGLGGISAIQGRFSDAASYYQAALERYRSCGDLAGQGRALVNLGLTECELHDGASAVGFYHQAINAFQDGGDRLGAAGALCGLARTELQLGSPDQASEHLQLALQVFRDMGDQTREAEALSAIGEVSLHRGDLAHAATAHEQALAIFRQMDQPAVIAAELANLGEVDVRRGDYQQAISNLRQALALLRQTGGQHREIFALRVLAQALHGDGQPVAARAELMTALRLVTETGNTYRQASVHCDLADSYCGDGQDGQARHHWQQALALYIRIGSPKADHVRSQLTTHQARRAGPQPDLPGRCWHPASDAISVPDWLVLDLRSASLAFRADSRPHSDASWLPVRVCADWRDFAHLVTARFSEYLPWPRPRRPPPTSSNTLHDQVFINFPGALVSYPLARIFPGWRLSKGALM
jgi:DNA-binding SARP family transcriptional activator/tetratricopeptide (TPR) repeat protein